MTAQVVGGSRDGSMVAWSGWPSQIVLGTNIVGEGGAMLSEVYVSIRAGARIVWKFVGYSGRVRP